MGGAEGSMSKGDDSEQVQQQATPTLLPANHQSLEGSYQVMMGMIILMAVRTTPCPPSLGLREFYLKSKFRESEQ